MSNNIDRQYLELVNHILQNGWDKKDRTGTGTKSVFGWQIRHSMKDGFPLLTTKKVAFKTMATELLWFLRGDTHIKFLHDNSCHIWDGDLYQNYNNIQSTHHAINEARNMVNMMGSKPLESTKPLSQEEFINKIKTDNEFAKQWGELGPVYGKQWRDWNDNGRDDYLKGVDQIANVIHLLKTDPDSRRMIVNAWNVGELHHMVLPPCHMMFQFYTRELSLEERFELFKKQNNGSHPEDIEVMDDYNIPTRAISLRWDQRSCDIALGIPMNISSYALLLMMIAKQVNMVPEDLIGDLGDCHIYNDHIEGMREQLTRTPYELPTVEISDKVVEDLSEYTVEDFKLKNYVSHPKIHFPLSN